MKNVFMSRLFFATACLSLLSVYADRAQAADDRALQASVRFDDGAINLPQHGDGVIRFSGDPCTCNDRGGAGIITLGFNNNGEKPSAYVEINAQAQMQEASGGNPSIRVYMPDESVYQAHRIGHMSVMKELGEPNIILSDYTCHGSYAMATIAVDARLVYAKNIVASAMEQYVPDRQAQLTIPPQTLRLRRALVSDETCPDQ